MPDIASLTPRRAAEIRDIHQALEAIGAQRWAQDADAEALRRLRDSFDIVRALVVAGGGPDMIRCAKDRFFRVLFRSTGDSVMPDSLLRIAPATRIIRRASLTRPGRPAEMLVELEAILAAAGTRDRTALTAACLRHIDNEFSSGLAALTGRR